MKTASHEDIAGDEIISAQTMGLVFLNPLHYDTLVLVLDKR